MRSPRQFLKHEGGVALLEFVLVMPLMMLLLFGSIELIRIMLMEQRLEKSGYVIADIISRYIPAGNPLTAGEISVAEMNANVFPTYGRIMGEFQGGPIQAVIATSIVKESGVKKIKWQMAYANNTLSGCDSGGRCVTSIVNGRAPAAINASVLNTPTSFPAAEEAVLATMADGDNLIVSEVFISYTPILQPILQGLTNLGYSNFFIQPRYFIKRSYTAPRNGNLVYLPPTFPAP